MTDLYPSNIKSTVSELDRYARAEKILELSTKIIDPRIAEIVEKSLDGRDLTDEDALEILSVSSGPELHVLDLCADYVRWLEVGDLVTFVVNRNINFTNGCVIRCRFCAFSRNPDDPEAYVLSVEEVVRRAVEARALGATEVCIQGGINPKVEPEYYFRILREIKKAVPDIHIHAFSPQEVHYVAKRTGMSYADTLRALKESGLDTMPGTAAEILDDRVRKIISPGRIDVRTWVEIVKTAHRLGIRSTATIMYGHVESNEQRVRHLSIIREIQRETRGFTELVLLPFVHYNTPLYRSGMSRPGSSGIDDVKMCIASRLYLRGYIKNIQVSWVKLGKKFAQTMLTCGANDLGGTLFEENISRLAGSPHGTYMSVDEFVKVIRELNRVPAQRTTTYEIVRVFS